MYWQRQLGGVSNGSHTCKHHHQTKFANVRQLWNHWCRNQYQYGVIAVIWWEHCAYDRCKVSVVQRSICVGWVRRSERDCVRSVSDNRCRICERRCAHIHVEQIGKANDADRQYGCEPPQNVYIVEASTHCNHTFRKQLFENKQSYQLHAIDKRAQVTFAITVGKLSATEIHIMGSNKMIGDRITAKWTAVNGWMHEA